MAGAADAAPGVMCGVSIITTSLATLATAGAESRRLGAAVAPPGVLSGVKLGTRGGGGILPVAGVVGMGSREGPPMAAADGVLWVPGIGH